MGSRRTEIVTRCGRILEKLIGHERTDGMRAQIVGSRIAMTISIESGQWIVTTQLNGVHQRRFAAIEVSLPLSWLLLPKGTY